MKFEEIYTEYFSDVYRYILRLSGDEHIAEEITSEAFFKALSSLDKFRGESEVRVWLCGIAKNLYYQYLKKKKPIVSIDDDGVGEIHDDSADVTEHAADKSHAEQIRRILHSIPDPYREVFMWRVFAELDFKEIAKLFGKTDNWACVTYHRAKNMIKERMEEKK